MAEKTIEQMRAAVAKADMEAAAQRAKEMAEISERIRAFNDDPVVEQFKEKLAALDGIKATESHTSCITIGLQGLSTLA